MLRRALPLLLLLAACRTGDAPAPKPKKATAAPTAAATSESPVAPIATLAGHALAGPTTHAVIVGVLEFADPKTAGWSKDQRKDQELYDTLRARGVPADNMALLLDEAATEAATWAALKRVSQRARAGDTLLFYYAGHGVLQAGEHAFLGYDRTIAVERVGRIVKESFRGKRAFFMADACYSGALKKAVEAVARPGLEAVSLTSAEASNLSTNNWTFTQTVIDGLRGDGILDANADGTVALGELAAGVASAMKYREKQRHGFFLSGVSGALPLAKAGPGKPGEGALAVGSYVTAERDGTSEVAQIRSLQGEQRLVRFYDYNHGIDERVAASTLSPITFERHAVGTKLQVFWGRELYAARVVKTDGDFHFVAYDGWGPEWNEWVMSDRIALEPKGGQEIVSVEWEGAWWPAVVLKTDGPKTLIHYVGYGSEWDEWIAPKRLRRDGGKSAKGSTPGVADTSSIEVEWRGQWYSATVLKQQGGRFLIHYLGYGEEWDEWVTPARVRRAGGAARKPPAAP